MVDTSQYERFGAAPSPPAPPGVPSPHTSVPPPAPKKRRGLLLLLGAIAAGLFGCGALLAVASNLETDGDGAATSVNSLADEPREDVATSTAPSTDDVAAGDEATAPETVVENQGGDRANPFALGDQTTITWDSFGDADGSTWNVTVSEVRDLTADVLDENPFNDAPPEGVVYAGFDISMSLVDADKVPLSQSFNFGWELVGGSTNAAYDVTTLETENFGCGIVPNAWDGLAEVFIGGTLEGTMCIPLPADDLVDPATAVSMRFDERVYFAADGSSPKAVPTPEPEPAFAIESRDGGRRSPYAFDASTSVTFDSFGEADGSVWTVTVGEPRDISAAVVAENQFNDGPLPGTMFAGFDVTMTLDSADKEPLAPAFNLSWEVTGGATAGVYDTLSLGPNGAGCGVAPNEFDVFSEVFAGGTLRGTVCVPIPTADLEHPNSRVAIKFAEDTRVYFG